MYSRNGRVQVTKSKIIFYDNLSLVDEDGAGTGSAMLDFFTYKKKSYKALYTAFDIKNIRYVFKRRFLFEKQWIDIIFKSCNSITLNFKKEDEFLKFCKTLSDNNPEVKSFMTTFKKSKITEGWKEGKISNYKYIMLLNYYGSRSYNDLSQYPVIPWFLSYDAYTSDEIDETNVPARDFSQNLATLGSQKRLEHFMDRYMEDNDMNGGDKYFIGSHYSNPGVILQYLVRIPPFLDGLIKFQSGKLDWADRMYANITLSYYLALNENGDVRELIPESTFLPEMYRNILKVNFGETQEKNTVDHVILPQWAKEDPYIFTYKMREFFESENVAENIHKWFDLIFGYKQKGDAAVEAWNLYPSITYEDGIDINKPENQEMKSPLLIQAYNYGQWATQLFTEPHIKRDPVKSTCLFFESGAELDSKTFDFSKKKYGIITAGKFINKEDLIIFGNKNILYQLTYTQFSPNSKTEILSEKKDWKKVKIIFDDSKLFMNENTPMKILVKGDIRIIIGGYWDGSIIIQNFTKKQEISKKKHLFRITMIEVSESEEVVITGTEKGDIVKWALDGSHLIYQKPFFHHDNTVTGAWIEEDMGIFATWSKDGTANLYTLSPCFILRSFRNPQNQPLSRVYISEAPLAALITCKQNSFNFL